LRWKAIDLLRKSEARGGKE
jgi:hypothetical protein